jgi:hypothetical protein
MLSHRTLFAALLTSFAIVSIAEAQAPQIGVVADDYNKAVHVFDWGNGSKLGTVYIPQPDSEPTSMGDCVITSDGTLAYVTDYYYQIWVIDLTADPPALASGTNPIVVASPGDDLAITADDRYLLVAGGSTSGTFGDRQGPAVSVDLQTRAQISSIAFPYSPNSIELCDDGSTVLVTAPSSFGFVAKMTLNSNGTMFNTGQSTPIIAAKNATCIPGSQYAIVGSLFDDIYIIDMSDLSIVSSHTTAGYSFVSAVSSPAGDRLYVRSRAVPYEYDGPSIVEVFEFDPATGAFNDIPLFDIPVDNDISGQGMDKLALSEGGELLFVPMNPSVQAGGTTNPDILDIDRVDIFQTSDGALYDSIWYTENSGLYSLSGIAAIGSLAPQILEVDIDIEPGDPLNEINLAKDRDVDVVVFGSANFDVSRIEPSSVLFAGAPIQVHKNGNLRIWFADENNDGREDLRARFNTSDLQINTNSTSAILTGMTLDDDLFVGSDDVMVTSQSKGNGNGNNGNGKGPKNR